MLHKLGATTNDFPDMLLLVLLLGNAQVDIVLSELPGDLGLCAARSVTV